MQMILLSGPSNTQNHAKRKPGAFPRLSPTRLVPIHLTESNRPEGHLYLPLTRTCPLPAPTSCACAYPVLVPGVGLPYDSLRIAKTGWAQGVNDDRALTFERLLAKALA
jgi:hypothetical protein